MEEIFILFFDCCFQLEQQSFFLIGVDGYEESGGPLRRKTGFLVVSILVFLRRGRFTSSSEFSYLTLVQVAFALCSSRDRYC